MPFVLMNQHDEWLTKRTSWDTEWSDNLQKAKPYRTRDAATAAIKYLYDGYHKPIQNMSVDVVEVKLSVL